ncbi:MAG TPA: hypothetical protein VH309_11245 [Elusimicrobiota bacterium]|nr:hypothetical protein [Elusimicrobiota bacterium]
MRALVAVVLLAVSASAKVRLVPAIPPPAPAPAEAPAPQLAGARSGGPYWFKVYSTSPYREVWTGDLAMKDYDGDLPKVVKAIEANGGELTQPLANFVSSRRDKSRQLSFSVPRKNAKALLRSLRALGDMPDPSVRALGAPIPLAEVRSKIAVMMKEKSEHGADLARVPAAAAAEEEILEHLLMVEELATRAVVEARFNLLVRQK